MEAKEILNASLVVVLFFGILQYGYPSMRNHLGPWNNPTVLIEESESAEWAYANLPKNASFAADLFACEMITAVAVRVCSIGGAWELADRPNERYLATERAFLTNSSQEAHRIFQEYNVTHVLFGKRTGFYAYGWKEPELSKFSDRTYFEPVFSKGKAQILRVVQ